MQNNNFIYSFISNFYRVLLSRAFITGFILISEVISVFVIFTYFSFASLYFAIAHIVLTLAILFSLLHKNTHPSYKLSWAVIILLFPFAGGFAYLIFANKKIPKKLRNIELEANSKREREEYPSLILDKEIELYDKDLLKLFKYIKNSAYYNYYKYTKTKYYASGKDMFEDAIDDLKKAKNFIFLEYFIIARGELLTEILEVLKERIENGVDVYLIYDDFGSITTVDDEFIQELESIGIDVTSFNKMRLGSVSKLNYRTHRKIMVIDNKIAYTGGVNIADEYVDKKIRFGKWKDTAVRIEGEAVRNFTVAFTQSYYASNGIEFSNDDFTFDRYRIPSNEYVLPFSISPSDNYSISRNIHLSLLNTAKKTFHIQTPYLIIDYGLTNALINASKSGVEVIITVPSIPDKKIVNYVTKNNYKKLIENGVRIYEYNPGFLHSKSCIVDSEVLLMSGINMDFRSYFLNYESGVLIANSKSCQDAENDFAKTLEDSTEITLDDLAKMPMTYKLLGFLFSIFAPLI